MKTFCFLCLTSFLLVLAQLAVPLAQASEGEWRTYTVVDGLASPDVTTIFQDSRGDMWFGASSGGVSRFDGENFQSFTEKNGLPNGSITQILEDKRGHLWFIFRPDLGVTGVVVRYDGKMLHQITEQDGLAGGSSNAMLKDKSGNLWFANAYGLTKYDGSRFQQFGVAIFESRNGDIWLGGGYRAIPNQPPAFVIRYDGSAFHYFPLDDFPPSSAIYTIAEDDAGNLLFGGAHILCKYDGVSFEHFENELIIEKGETLTLKMGKVSATAVEKGESVTLKVGDVSVTATEREDELVTLRVGYVMTTSPLGSTFVIAYKEPPLPKQSSAYTATPLMEGGAGSSGSSRDLLGRNVITHFGIWFDSFFKDSHGKLWFNMSNYLFLWDGNRLQHFPSLSWDATQEPVPFDEKGQPYWFPGEVVFEDGSGNLWFKNANGVHRYDGTSFQTFTVDDGLGSDNISVIFEDKDGKFWFGHDNGVTVFDPTPIIQNFTTRGALGSNKIDLIYEDKQGFVWFSLPGGVARYDGEKLQYFSAKQMGTPNPNVDIIGIVDDEKDGVWFVGRSTNEIFRYKNGQFRHYSVFRLGAGSSGEGPKFLSDSEGYLWLGFGTPESPIRCDGEKFEFLTVHGWETVPQNKGMSISSPRITDIHADRKGVIWFAARDEGVKRYDGVSLKTFTTADGLGSNNILKIFEDKGGNLWFFPTATALLDASQSVMISVTMMYVSRYDGKSIRNFSIKPVTIVQPTRIDMHQDIHGILWFIGDEIGICRYDGTDFEQVPGMLHHPFVSIIDRAGNLWLATGKGAIRYDGVKFHIYTTEDGFLINDIGDVREDRQGNIWFATWGGGVVRYDGKAFQPITTKHGLINNNVQRIFEDSRGSLWFATNGGITKYTPKGTELPPRIKLTKVIANKKTYTDFDEALQLPAKVRHVAFEYQGFSLKRAKLLYTHKLVGHDKDWSQPSSENRVEYKGLKPGRYVFWVKAIREDLKYSNPPASIVFTISEPFYKRLNFILPVSLGGLLVLLLFSQRRAMAKLSKRLFSAEEKVQQTQAQLIQAEKMATVGTLAGGVAHEINNPLDAILGSVQRILRVSEEPKVVESAQSAQEGARRCKNIVEKLLKYARQSNDEFTSLEVNQVIEDTVALLAHQLKLENISLDMQLSPSLKVQGNFNELSQVITNLLTNAKDAIVAAKVAQETQDKATSSERRLKPATPSAGSSDKPPHTEAGIITVHTAAINHEVLIEVADNGIGIKEEHLGNLFDPFFTTKPVGKGTGLGLSICQGIVEKHQGRIEVESKVGEGATFRVFLPLP